MTKPPPPPRNPLSQPLGMSGISASGTGLVSVGSATSSTRIQSNVRSKFDASELAIVLSHFDIGIIDAVQEFPRGSRKAPKLLMRTDTGLYLLKRRAQGKDDPFKVAFCHHLQLHLANQQFPLPHLIGTKKDNNSMLQCKDHIYELFEYIKGINYDNSLQATQDSGKTLALFHRLLATYESEYESAVGSYHNSRTVALSFDTIPKTLSMLDPQHLEKEAGHIAESIQYLRATYNAAAIRVNELGFDQWPQQIVHSDWHPGNMLFRGSRVVAVIDYDTARLQQRITDIANGTLQFSILGSKEKPSKWPEHLDEKRFIQFLQGYESVPDCILSKVELKSIPWLMIQALIAESVIPIAATGSFARMDGVGFLLMVERKVRWLEKHASRLLTMMDAD